MVHRLSVASNQRRPSARWPRSGQNHDRATARRRPRSGSPRVTHAPGQGGAHVVVFGVQPCEPLELVGGTQVRRGLRGQLHEELRMSLLDVGGFPGCDELFSAELADRLQHAEARLAVAAARPLRARLLATSDETPSSTSVPSRPSTPQTASAASRVQPPTKTRQPTEQGLLARLEQVVAPGDGVAQRLLAGRQVARATGQQRQALLQPREHRLRRQDSHAGRRQLDASGRPSSAADLGHGRGVLVGEREIGPDRASRARRTGPPRRTATRPPRAAGDRPGNASGGTANSCSPWRRSGARLVTRMLRRGLAASSSATTGAAGRMCSKLSSTSSMLRSRR